MAITEITPTYSVSPQIRPEEVADIAALGFRSILCNRPDGESDDQTPVAAVRAEAERLGLAFAYVPVISGQIDADDVADFHEHAGDVTLLDVFTEFRNLEFCSHLKIWDLGI
jgi:sulfide:quinone oxidoreductase